MSTDTICPDPARVAQLMVGDLPESEVDAICEHVTNCPACTTILRNLSDEQTVLNSAVLSADSWTADPDDVVAIEQLISRWRSHPVHIVANGGSASPDTVGDTSRSSANECPTEVESNVNLEELTKRLLAPPTSPGELGWLGSYRVLSVIGSGGMGVVFEAEDPRLGRRVAVKAMQPSLQGREEHKLRFLREARTAASIDHDNIVPIHQVGEDRDVPFFVMPLLKGESLQSRLRRDGKLSVTETVCIGKQIAIGIAAAHGRGLIHRDIKPANIWLEDRGLQHPRVRILDFGLARAEDDELHLTRTGSIAGTPAFMSPEQARGELSDARSDLFSLGCVLYCSLTGKPPFSGRNSAALMFAIINHQPQPLTDIEPPVPASLAALVMRLLQKDPAQRFELADDVAEALTRIENESSRPDPVSDTHSKQQLNTLPPPQSIAEEPAPYPMPATPAADLRRFPSGEQIDSEGSRKFGRRSGDRRWAAVPVLSSLAAIAILAGGIIWWYRPTEETAGTINNANGSGATAPAAITNGAASPPVEGLAMWLRADRGTETDADGGVRLWTDQSSKSNHNAVQLVAAHRPKLVPDALNSHPVMKFDGNDAFDLAGQVIQSQEFTIIAVASYQNVTQQIGSRILISNWDDLRTHNSVFLGVMDIDGVFPRFTDDLAGTTDQDSQKTVRALIEKPGRHFVFTARSSKTDAEIFINQKRLIGTGRPLGQRDLSGTWRIGTQGAGFECWSGELAELIVYDQALSESELQASWTYLNERYFSTAKVQPNGEPVALNGDSGKQKLKADVEPDEPKNASNVSQAVAPNTPAEAQQSEKRPSSVVQPGLPGRMAFPGLVPRPTQLAGLRRWQMETLAPRGDIFAVAWDRDGRRVACGSPIGNVRIIDVESSKTLGIIPAHAGSVWAMDWSPTEDLIVTAGDDGAVRLFDSQGKSLRHLGSHVGTARSIAFNRDGTWIASGGFDRKVRLWRTTGEAGPVLSGHGSQVDGVAWHPSGKKLASAGLDGTVRIWDLNGTWHTTGMRGQEVKGHLGGVLGLSWSPDGELLASAGVDGTILLSNSDGTQHSVLSGHGSVVTAISWGEAGLIATSGEDKTVRLWQRDGTLLKTQNLDAGRINDLEWSRDGSRLAIATGSQGIRLMSAAGEWDGTIALDTISMRALSFNSTGELATAGDGGMVAIWNADGTRRAQLKGHAKTVYSVNWNPAGTQLITGSWEAAVRIWNANGETTSTRTGTNPVAWNPTGEEIAWTSGSDVQFEIPGSLARVLHGHKSQIVRLVWNATGTQLASADVNGDIRIWNRDGSPAGLIQSDPAIMALAWHPTKPFLASGSAGNGNIHLWSLGGKLVKKWNGHMKGAIALDWSPTGERLMSSAYDQRVRIWNQDGNAVGELPGPMAIGCAAAWNATGQQIATAHIDGVIRLWNGNTYEAKSTTVTFNDGNWARFDSQGLSSSSDSSAIDSRFVVVTEDERGAIGLWKVSEFREQQTPPGN